MLTVTVQSQQVRDILAQLAARMSDLTPAMAAIGQELESRVSARFETETDPNGRPWAPWAQSTRDSYPFPGSAPAKKDGKPGNGRILDRYNDMLNGLSHQASATSVRIGFDQAYSTYHEWGTKTMPRRGLLMDDPDACTLSKDDEMAVFDILSTFLSEE